MYVCDIYSKGMIDNSGEIYTVYEQLARSSERKIYVNITSNFFTLWLGEWWYYWLKHTELP